MSDNVAVEIVFGLKDALAELKQLVPQSLNFQDLKLDPRSPNFADDLKRWMDVAHGIHFNLSYMRWINAPNGVLNCPPAMNDKGSTNWELRTIWDDPALRQKTVFYLYGKIITENDVEKLP